MAKKAASTSEADSTAPKESPEVNVEKTNPNNPSTDGPPEAGTAKSVDDGIKSLAEKIFIQMCVNQRPGFKVDHNVKMAHDYAKAFIKHQPS